MDENQKKEFITKKYKELISNIEKLLEPNELNKEIKTKLSGLWAIYHYLDCDIINWIDTINEGKFKYQNCDSNCNSPTF
jgi:hypothetical protein